MGRSVNQVGNLTKDYVLKNVSQITIFSTYLNIPVTIIQDCIDNNTMITSPLRSDFKPTCGFRYDNKGKLKFKDFAGYFWGDCFDVVALILSKLNKRVYSVTDKRDFYDVLKHITVTFSDIFYGTNKDINLSNEIQFAIDKIKSDKPVIEIVVRNWTDRDIKWWGKFGIDIHTLNVNFVYPVEQYYIDRSVNPQPKYFYDVKDPCYAYMLGVDKNGKHNIKLYFPQRKKGVRFITNCNHLEGIYNLGKTEYDIIVITKSTKDRIALHSAVASSLYGGANIGIINVPHETYKLRQYEYDWLSSKLSNNGFIVSLMDNDIPGIKEARWLKQNYKIQPLIIPRSTNAKDFSDLVSISTQGEVKRYLQLAYEFTTDRQRAINADESIGTEQIQFHNTIPF